jgi:acyl-CoA synthetase (AMP-forming)/AMP-acid ligase II
MSTEAPTKHFDGLMMRTPLLVRSILGRAEQLFGAREIVSFSADGVERSTYGEVAMRARRLAGALHELGIRKGDRVATFGWNSRRHLELYMAVPAMGAVLHTLNVRLFEDDLRYIVSHAEDRVIFLDASLAAEMPHFEGVEYEVLMPDADGQRDGALEYEQLIEGGELEVRGSTIARAYYNDETGADKFTEDGWLRTGDVAEVKDGAFIKLVDRTKDLVKSGGEWISSVELENAIMAHPDVVEAAVVAVPHERWSERPCACVVRREGTALDGDGLREFLATRVAKWWLPERVEFIVEVPKTSVGKFDKKVLRSKLADDSLETV